MHTKHKRLTSILSWIIIASTSAHASILANNSEDEGNPRTQGNGGTSLQLVITESPPTNLAVSGNNPTIDIINHGGSEIYSLEINNNHGAKLQQFPNKIAPNQQIKISLSRDLLNPRNQIFFYDQAHRLLSVYDMANLTRGMQNYSIYADKNSLGIYAFRQIRKINPSISYDQLTTTLGLGANELSFAELGSYYANKLNHEHQSNEQIIVDLTQAIENKQIIKTDNLPSTAANLAQLNSSSGSSNSPFCSKIFTEGVKAIGGMTGANPAMLGIKVVTSLIGGITGVACPSAQSAPDYSRQFSEIQAKLNQIDTNIQLVRSGVAQLSQQLSRATIATTMISYSTAANTINDYLRSYYFNILQHDKDPQGKLHTNLKSLVASYGGFNTLMNSEKSPNPHLKQQLAKLIDETNNLKIQFNTLSNRERMDKVHADLKQMCGDANTISGSAVDTRLWCNLKIVEIYTQNMTTANALLTSFQDIYDTIGSDPQQSINFPYLNNQQQLTLDFNNYETALQKAFAAENSLFPFFKEFQIGALNTLYNNINKVGCTITLENAGHNITLPYIVDWIPDQNMEPYLLSKCPGSANSKDGEEVLSRYYYTRNDRDTNGNILDSQKQHTTVKNVMGVLVPQEYFKNNQSFAASGFNYLDRVTQDGKYQEQSIFDQYALFYSINVPNSSQLYAQQTEDFKISNITEDILYPTDYKFDYRRNSYSYFRALYKYNNPTSASISAKFYNADWNNIHNQDLYTFLRYTESNGQSYVWAIRNRLNFLGSTMHLDISQQCMTFNCTIINGEFGGKVAFDDGPAFTFGPHPLHSDRQLRKLEVTY